MLRIISDRDKETLKTESRNDKDFQYAIKIIKRKTASHETASLLIIF